MSFTEALVSLFILSASYPRTVYFSASRKPTYLRPVMPILASFDRIFAKVSLTDPVLAMFQLNPVGTVRGGKGE